MHVSVRHLPTGLRVRRALVLRSAPAYSPASLSTAAFVGTASGNPSSSRQSSRGRTDGTCPSRLARSRIPSVPVIPSPSSEEGPNTCGRAISPREDLVHHCPSGGVVGCVPQENKGRNADAPAARPAQTGRMNGESEPFRPPQSLPRSSHPRCGWSHNDRLDACSAAGMDSRAVAGPHHHTLSTHRFPGPETVAHQDRSAAQRGGRSSHRGGTTLKGADADLVRTHSGVLAARTGTFAIEPLQPVA